MIMVLSNYDERQVCWSGMVVPTSTRSTRPIEKAADKTTDHAEDASRALTATFLCVMQRIKQETGRSAAEFEVSVAQVRALYALQEPLSMRDLAERLYLDPSNLTALVDRLEDLGLVERRADSEDRRVKRIVVTPAGCAPPREDGAGSVREEPGLRCSRRA